MSNLSDIVESSVRNAAPWAVYLGFLVGAGVPGFCRRLPAWLRGFLIWGFSMIAIAGSPTSQQVRWVLGSGLGLGLGLGGVAVFARHLFRMRQGVPRKSPVPSDQPDRRLWVWVLAGAWPVLMGLAILLELLQSDLRRAEARAAEEATTLARGAAAAFERTFWEPLNVDVPRGRSTPMSIRRDRGENRLEPPEWWLKATPEFRRLWEQAAAVPPSAASNPWRGFPAAAAGPEATAVAQFLEVRHATRGGTLSDPVTELERVRAAAPHARTPAGLPVPVLAWMELFRLVRYADRRPPGALQGAFLEDLRRCPPILWPSILESLQASGWTVGDHDWIPALEMLRQQLRQHESEAPWCEAVALRLERHPGAAVLLIEGPEGLRLFRSADLPNDPLRSNSPDLLGRLFGEDWVQAALRSASGQPGLRADTGWAVRFRYAGQFRNADGDVDTTFRYSPNILSSRLLTYHGDQGRWKTLASEVLVPDDGEGFRVEVGLADPASYFASVRRQAVWTGGLGVATAGMLIAALFLGRRAYLKLQELHEAQTNFVAGVTHELRAPLASVRLLVENLQRGGDSSGERRREYYDLIVRECRRLGMLVQNVLDWSRIEQGHREYQFRPTDLPALVSETVRVLEPQFGLRRVRLALRLPEVSPDLSEPAAMVDAAALQQCLVNLLDNALKHAPEDSEVVVALERGGGQWTLSVADAGPGIPEAEQRRIFDRFHRLGSELRRETEGVGIGLSLVKHIVEGHRGVVRVESRPGEGARFIVTLPANSQPQTQTDGGTP